MDMKFLSTICIVWMVFASCVSTFGQGVAIRSLNGLGTNLNVKAAAGSSLALTVNTNTFVVTGGNVGIGTPTPANKLDVEGAVAIGATYSGTSTAPANGAIIEGFVGIGQPIPSEQLEVRTTGGNNADAPITSMINGMKILDTSSDGTYADVGILLGGGAGEYAFVTAHKTSTTTIDLSLGANDVEVMRLKSTGDIGIGTVAPRGKLEVAGGIIISNTGSGLKIGPGNATLTNTLYASATLDFPSTVAGTVSDLLITVAGAADGDIIALGEPSGSIGPLTGVYNAWASNGVVYVRFANNNLVTAQDPASGLFKVRVDKFQ